MAAVNQNAKSLTILSLYGDEIDGLKAVCEASDNQRKGAVPVMAAKTGICISAQKTTVYIEKRSTWRYPPQR